MSGTGSTVAQTRRGSAFSDKQIYQAVRDGRAVEIRTSTTGRPVLGWFYGMDDFHWGLVDIHGDTHMIHKSAPLVTFKPDLLSKQTPEVQEMISPIVAGFRDYVMETIYHINPLHAVTI